MKILNERIDHALDELLTEVSCVIHSDGKRPIDVSALKSCYDKYHALIHERTMDNLGAIAAGLKPGPVMAEKPWHPSCPRYPSNGPCNCG